jgi:hypothetical protein
VGTEQAISTDNLVELKESIVVNIVRVG